MCEDNPFWCDEDSVAAKSVAPCPDCGGDSFYDYSAELYEDLDGSLLYCNECFKQWLYKPKPIW